MVAWSGGDAVGEDLELKGDTRDWCQFADKANSGVQSTFNMEDYTSKLNVKESRYTEEDAARIAREIEAEKLDLPQKLLDDSGVSSLLAVCVCDVLVRYLMRKFCLQLKKIRHGNPQNPFHG